MREGIETWAVSRESEGQRLDRFLVLQLPELGRALATRWVAEGRVRINGRRAPKSRILAVGDKVSVDVPEQVAVLFEPQAALTLVVEQEQVVVVDKPAGQPSAPLRSGERGTLANALVGRYPEMANIGYRPREPGLVHRLDTATSGLVIAARTSSAFDILRNALERRMLHKRYLAIVLDRDVPDELVVIRTGLSWVRGSGRVQVVDIEPGSIGAESTRPMQESRVRLIARRKRWALVEVEAKRAFRHQVRVHLASRGWPIIGDKLYGDEVSEVLTTRHALHASHVAWAGDTRLPAFAADSGLPEDLLDFWDT